MFETAANRCGQWLSRWKGWSRGSVNRRIFSAALVVALGTVAVKAIAVPKEILIAYRFGVGDALDAFLIAFLIPSFAINVVADSFNAAFIPTFVRLREDQGKRAANELFSSVLLASFALLTIVALLLAYTAPFLLDLVAGEFGPEKKRLTLHLFYLLLPVTVIHGLVVLCAAVLNASERFGLASLTPAATPIAIIALLAGWGSNWGIYVVAWGTLAGPIIELLFLGVALKRKEFQIMPSWHGFTEPLRHVLGQYFPMVMAAFAMCSTFLVDQGMAAWLPAGSVGALNFGTKLPTLLTSVGSIALGTAVLPHFSRLVASGDYAGIRNTLKSYLALIVVVTVPITLVCIVCSEWLVRLLYQRGAFSVADTLVVAEIQSFYFLMFPFYVVCILGVRLLSALSKNHVLAFGSALNFVVNVAGNYLLMKVFGVAGIALSTAIVYAVSATFIFYVLSRLLRSARKVGRSAA